jgi:glycosyltransferase involved in cell wall biosynthesis
MEQTAGDRSPHPARHTSSLKHSLLPQGFRKLSIVAPVFNEASHVSEFVDRCVVAARACLLSTFEVILVDDGSWDRSREVIAHKIREYPGLVKLVELSRNFGQQSAFHAGLSLAVGDVVVTLDSDLQDPPELIPRLVEKMRDGHSLVYARRVSVAGGSWGASGHSGLKAIGAYVFHRLMSRMASYPIASDVGEYRCMSRRVVDHLLEFPETSIFLPGLVAYVGFSASSVEYVRQKRSDRAPTTLWRLTGRALDALTSFSIAPLVLVMPLALAAWLVPAGMLVWLLVDALVFRRASSTTALGWLLGSIAWCLTLSVLAVIAHYLGRIFFEIKRRPRYFLRRIVDKGNDDE